MQLTKVISISILFTLGTFSAAVFADNGAEVINWGQDRIDCEATCGDGEDGVVCVVGGQLTIVTNNGNATVVCTAGEWLFEPPKKAQIEDVDCGIFGTGLAVITPSSKVNFTCHTE